MIPTYREHLSYAVLTACLALGPIPEILAQTPSAQQPGFTPDQPPTAETTDLKSPKDPWRVGVAATVWLMGMDGDVGVRGLTVNVNETFLDVVDKSDSLFALSGRAEVGYGKFGGYIDAMYASIGINDQSGPLGFGEVDIDIEQLILDFGVMYRIGDWEPTGEAAKNDLNMSLDLTGGGRYTDLQVTLGPEIAAERKDNEAWVDPVVGLRFIAPLSERWHVSLAGDVGGFGAASDFTWSATAMLGYSFHIGNCPSSVVAGYRALGWDYTNGSGTDEFTWNVVESGVIVGLVVRF